MRFAFYRGSLALDFVGTVGFRDADTPEERLKDVEALRVWLKESGLAADARPAEADLLAARRLREAIFALGRSAIAGTRPDPEALRTVNRAAAGLREGAPRLDPHLRRHWESAAPVAHAFGRIAGDAIEVLSTEATRLTRCECNGCGALLLSRSRGDRRRWCSMEKCGNRVKVAAFRARQKGLRAASAAPRGPPAPPRSPRVQRTRAR